MRTLLLDVHCGFVKHGLDHEIVRFLLLLRRAIGFRMGDVCVALALLLLVVAEAHDLLQVLVRSLDELHAYRVHSLVLLDLLPQQTLTSKLHLVLWRYKQVKGRL